MVADVMGTATRAIYINYEVSGYHSPFLDMVKIIYNDTFCSVFYADLLCHNVDLTTLSLKNNSTGAMVSWDL